MVFTKSQFIFALNNADQRTLTLLDKMYCKKCGFVSHWVNNMSRGTWNPNLTEMDVELKDVKTPEELYEFITSKTDAIQK